MKTLTNGMELAWHPVVGGLVEGDQGHRAAVGDVRHEPGGKNMVRWRNMVWWMKVIRIKHIEDLMSKMRFTHLEPGSCDLDLLTGFAILSLRPDAPIPLTLDADLPKLVPVGPILTMDTPSYTNVSSRFELLLDAVALSWRFVG